MKTQRIHQPRFFAALLAITMTCTLAGAAAIDDTSGDLPHAVSYQLGDAKFAPGDNITIQQMRGTSDTITTGGTYSVEGTYTLGSKDEADLAFYATTVSASGPTPVDPKQHIRIQKGTGSFHLVKTISEFGFPHVSFYPNPSGSSFGGVYFGQGAWVLHNSNFRIRDENVNSSSSEKPVSAAGPNQALLEYLGNPVEPPANMDAKYTKEGLINAIQLAARNAGITVKKVVIEDSEFPFLVGVICGGSDSIKLKEQLRKLDGYAYSGCIGNDTSLDGSDTCNVFSIVPSRAYPFEAGQRIYHRTWLRQQVFYDKLHAQK
jgi:hypothetical protein